MLSIKSKLGCFIGVQYFRPPNPPTKFWEKDIKNIRNLGFKVIRTWLYWSKVNPRPRKWDFNIYDRFVEIAHRNGLKVLIQLVPESPPQYILSKYSYAYYMNENGQIVKPYALGMVSIGGYPGLNPDMPEVRKLIEKFFIKTVSHYSGIDVHLYDVWNELMPHYRIPALLYNPSTQDRFRKWLKKKYGNIDSLNDAWGGSTYTDWSQIEMPLKGNYANMLDLHLFHRHWIREELKWRVKLVKKIDDEAICLSHTAGGLATVTKTPYNIWDLAEIVDIWGTSDYEIDFYRAALLHNLIRSSCNGGEWWLSEQTGGRTWTLFGEKHRSKTFIVQKMVQAISYGAKGNIIWQYRPEIFGQESPNFGLVFEDGTYTERTKAVSSLAKKLEKYSYIFDNLRFDKPDVGIVFDWRIRSLEYTAFNDPGKFSERELLGWHSLLTDISIDVSILSVENIVEKGIDKNIRLLIIPLLIQDMENIMEKLGLGTKATRPEHIQKLIDRKYVIRKSNRLHLTELGYKIRPVDEVIKPLYDNTKSIILGFRIKLFLKDRHHQIVYSRLYRDEIYRDRLKLICDLRDRLLRYPIKIASLYNTGDGYTFVIKIAGAGKTMYDSILTELNFKDLESYLDFKIVTIRIPDNYLNEKYLDLAYISNASLFLKTLASHNLEFDILYYNVISNEALIISKKEIPDTYRKYILKYARIINGVYKLVI